MAQSVIYMIVISLWLFFYRLWMRLVSVNPAWFISISWLIIFLCGICFIIIEKQFTIPHFSQKDILGISMVALMTGCIDYLIVQWIQKWIPAIQINIITSIAGLILFIIFSLVYFHDKITLPQILWIILWCISFFLLMYKA